MNASEKVECPRCFKPTVLGAGVCTCCGEMLPQWVINEFREQVGR